jgi:hypothetical protein
VEGVWSVEVTGEWTDHKPSLLGVSDLDPGPSELRFVSPLLLRDKQVLGDMEGGSAFAPDPGAAINLSFGGAGRYLVSLSPMKGAVTGQVRLNRVTFTVDGRNCTFLTGAPVTRSDKVWVLFEPDFKREEPESKGFIGSGVLAQIAPEAVVEASPAGK